MQIGERFRFESKLLKNRTSGLASMIEIAGGKKCQVEVNELLAIAGADSSTPLEEVEEARAELITVFSNKSHPFWELISDRENKKMAKILADMDARERAEWDALSAPRKTLKTIATFAVPLLFIYLFFKFKF